MVILPAQPTPQEIEVYLTLLADFSAQTGYPALRVSVGTAADMQSGADEDLLVIGTSGTTAGLPDNAAIAFLNEHLPVAILGRQLSITSQTDLRARLRNSWDEILGAFGKTPADFDLKQLPDAIFEGLESPFASKRSIVVLELNSSAVADAFLNSFLDASHSSDISGDVSVLQGSTFHSYRVSHSTYSLGHHSWYIALLQLFTAEPWSLVLGLLLFSVICAGRMQTLLERKSRTRLHLSDDLA
jgi:cellulose synthase (UDP-forming)